MLINIFLEYDQSKLVVSLYYCTLQIYIDMQLYCRHIAPSCDVLCTHTSKGQLKCRRTWRIPERPPPAMCGSHKPESKIILSTTLYRIFCFFYLLIGQVSFLYDSPPKKQDYNKASVRWRRNVQDLTKNVSFEMLVNDKIYSVSRKFNAIIHNPNYILQYCRNSVRKIIAESICIIKIYKYPRCSLEGENQRREGNLDLRIPPPPIYTHITISCNTKEAVIV